MGEFLRVEYRCVENGPRTAKGSGSFARARNVRRVKGVNMNLSIETGDSTCVRTERVKIDSYNGDFTINPLCTEDQMSAECQEVEIITRDN
ncbi:hypothetical protein EAI_04496 [Harpegnathos saltator]|uniref:Uncharacterized protein n=1 Tax=Harpegnathos saltator TaxID=610380 RepID=E2C5N7_HARSA|nr:hypothetical protein EAI_04496 [Harpegnathos saltator]